MEEIQDIQDIQDIQENIKVVSENFKDISENIIPQCNQIYGQEVQPLIKGLNSIISNVEGKLNTFTLFGKKPNIHNNHSVINNNQQNNQFLQNEQVIQKEKKSLISTFTKATSNQLNKSVISIKNDMNSFVAFDKKVTGYITYPFKQFYNKYLKNK